MFLTIDAGGRKFAYGAADASRVDILRELPSPASLDAFRQQLTQSVLPSLRQFDAVGVAMAGVIEDGRVIQSPNLPWLDGVDLRRWCCDLLQCPCVIRNDVEAAAIAESIEGRLAGVTCGIIESIGTGWGGCMVMTSPSGRPWIIPGEPGHMVSLGPDGPPCGCGRLGCNEARCAGAAIAHQTRQLFAADLDPAVDPCAFLDAAAHRGDPRAIQLYSQTAQAIGLGWVNTLNRISAIQRIVYCGSFIVHAIPYMLPRIQQVIHDRAMFRHHKQIPILQSELWPLGHHRGMALALLEHPAVAPLPSVPQCRS